MVRRLTIRMLERLGCSVEAVETTREALAQLQAFQFEFVFCDLNLPDGCGAELMRQAKDLAPATRRIIVSGELRHEDSAEYCNEWLPKPYTMDELSHALSQAARAPGAELS